MEQTSSRPREGTDEDQENCPEWKEPQYAVQYYSSANKGLGFYHVDVAKREGRFRHWARFDNFGVFTIEDGELEEAEIINYLRHEVDKEWEWKLMKLDDYRFLVRFPTDKRIENKILGKATYFYLKKDSVMASLRIWDGDIEPVGHLSEAWVVVRGVPPKWTDWITIKEIASSLGKLLEVDWQTLFASFFTVIRIRINCKDPKCIPAERVVEMDDQLYILNYTVEEAEVKEKTGAEEEGNGPDQDNDDDDDLLNEDPRGTRDNEEPGQPKDKPVNMEDSSKGDKGPAKSNSRSNPKSQSVQKAMHKFSVRMEEEGEIPNCVNLLKAMELNDSDDEQEGQGDEDNEKNEMSELPEEWTQPEIDLLDLHSIGRQFGMLPTTKQGDAEMLETRHETSPVKLDEQDQHQELEKEEAKKTKKKKWGPIVVERKSKRNVGGNTNAMKKVQDIKRKWREEINEGKKRASNSSPYIFVENILDCANTIGIVTLDGNPVDREIAENLEEIERKRSIQSDIVPPFSCQ
ncbi:unnamed protein product [Urochloa decumbens]|uniref:DUF4283 domain-containing protein n=1 Tax=Urochloa decumbens TaxID=240449 RepID=A0ABC9E934_9POAL